ncbi:MAG: hypothetical protein KBD37_00330 [Burkholderiales bacterium]|nr:hypothetical protein [Burkholderiales bacterium]
MTYKKNTPEYLIPNNANYFEKNGIEIRKGTMATIIINIEIIESPKSSIKDRKDAIEILKLLAPQLNAIGLNKHCVWRNPEIQSIFDKNNGG